MKPFIYALLLSTVLVAPLWADSHEGEPEEDSGIQITIDMDDDEAGNNEKSSEQELEKKIKRKVLSIFSDIIDAADEELTDAEREEVEDKIERKIEQAIEGIAEIEESKDDRGIFDDGITFLEALIPLTAIVFTFGLPLMIVAVVLYFSYRKKRLMHDTINQYVTSGKDIPPEVLKGLQKEVTPKNNLHKGLVMSGIGLGIIVCFGIMGGIEPASLGLIPLFIGLAQLLIWKLENK